MSKGLRNCGVETGRATESWPCSLDEADVLSSMTACPACACWSPGSASSSRCSSATTCCRRGCHCPTSPPHACTRARVSSGSACSCRCKALDDFARDRLADASERVRRALDVVTAAAVAAPPDALQTVAGPPRPRAAPASARRAGTRVGDDRHLDPAPPTPRGQPLRRQRAARCAEGSREPGCSRTVCGSEVPDHATVMAPTVDWHLHTNCYNCAYRLWPDHRLVGCLRPANGRDFPLRTECPHHQGRGIDAKGCITCTSAAARNWPCPAAAPTGWRSDRRAAPAGRPGNGRGRPGAAAGPAPLPGASARRPPCAARGEIVKTWGSGVSDKLNASVPVSR